MSMPSIRQALMLAEQFAILLERLRPASVAVFGCAGGNGLDRLNPHEVRRVVGVDINDQYIRETRARYAGRLADLELVCGDVQSDLLQFEPVEFIYAALVFEYVGVSATLATVKRNCREGGTLATVLQLPSASAVSPSPYESLGRLSTMIRLVAPSELRRMAELAGFSEATSEIVELSSRKAFCVQTFRLVQS
jgi:SAM-dependent methyltransferase